MFLLSSYEHLKFDLHIKHSTVGIQLQQIAWMPEEPTSERCVTLVKEYDDIIKVYHYGWRAVQCDTVQNFVCCSSTQTTQDLEKTETCKYVTIQHYS